MHLMVLSCAVLRLCIFTDGGSSSTRRGTGIVANRVDSQMQQVTALMIYGCKNNEQPNLSVIC